VRTLHVSFHSSHGVQFCRWVSVCDRGGSDSCFNTVAQRLVGNVSWCGMRVRGFQRNHTYRLPLIERGYPTALCTDVQTVFLTRSRCHGPSDVLALVSHAPAVLQINQIRDPEGMMWSEYSLVSSVLSTLREAFSTTPRGGRRIC
jgi:hypothetical protein